MEEMVKMLSSYGVSFVIVALFLWDYISNKKREERNQEVIKNTLDTVNNTTKTIANCLIEMQQNNKNMAKSLDILQQSVDNQSQKIDRLLDIEIANTIERHKDLSNGKETN